MPELYIIAGPNGAGKTTASKRLLPDVFHTDIFINADIIAARINPANPESVAVRAGRMMPEEIENRILQRETFAIEATLAARSYLQLVRRVQLSGYEVVLFFLFAFGRNSYTVGSAAGKQRRPPHSVRCHQTLVHGEYPEFIYLH